jgi:hypothetical protein
MHMTSFVVQQWSSSSITVSRLLCAAAGPVNTETSLPPELTPDQQAIIEKVDKPTGLGDRLRYAGAPTDPIGAEVRVAQLIASRRMESGRACVFGVSPLLRRVLTNPGI